MAADCAIPFVDEIKVMTLATKKCLSIFVLPHRMFLALPRRFKSARSGPRHEVASDEKIDN
jgi:hypothetical protein